MTRFSERTGWNTEESELARAHRLRRQAGLPIADLTASNPTRCGFRYPDSLLAALADPRALDYDPQPRGLLPAREAVCRYYADHGVALDPSQIMLTTSTSEAYSFLFRLLCDPGGEVLVPQPSYPLFDFLAALDDVRIKAAPLVYDDGWQIDFEGLRRAITPQTRAIVIVHPNNPTGHFTKAVGGGRTGHDLPCTRTFADRGRSFLGLRLRGDATEFCCGAGGGSGVRGERIEQDRRAAADEGGMDRRNRAGKGASTRPAGGDCRYLSLDECAGAVGAAGVASWQGGDSGADSEAREREPGRAGPPACHDCPALQRLAVEGGWYAVLRVPALEPDEQTVLALLERGVWVHPGYFFGLPESGWLVVSLLSEEAEFNGGVVTVTNYFRTNHGGNITR